jgi:hypothetical protein
MLDRIPRDEPVYVSIDIDVLDLPLVPGCASRGNGPATMSCARRSSRSHAAEVVGFDLVEVNPMLDVASETPRSSPRSSSWSSWRESWSIPVPAPSGSRHGGSDDAAPPRGAITA